MGALGLPSFLQLDLLLRSKRLLPSIQPASDSTFARTLNLMSLHPLRLILKSIALKVINSGKGKAELPEVGKAKMGIVDGTTFGKMYASVISISGQVDMPIDIEPWEGRGKELHASYTLLDRFLKTYGKGFVDYTVADGLYANRNFFSFCIEKLGCHGVAKTDEDRLQVIDFAEGLFRTYQEGDEYIEYVEGIDSLRMERYQIWATSYIEWEGLKYPLRVAKVIEEHLGGKYKGKIEIYYVITTDTNLPGLAMKELAKIRWHIENETFKALNEQCHSKHCFVRGEGMAALELILFISLFILVEVYKEMVEERKEELNLKRWHKISFRFLRELFRYSLGVEDSS